MHSEISFHLRDAHQTKVMPGAPSLKEVSSMTLLTKAPVLSKHKEEDAVDIIAVHGLDQKVLELKRQDDVQWLREFVPKDVKHSRILSFGYGVLPLLEDSSEGLRKIIQRLLEEVALIRRATPSARPLVFLCHGFGGILVQAVSNRLSFPPSSPEVM